MKYILPLAIAFTAVFSGCAGGPSYQSPASTVMPKSAGMQQRLPRSGKADLSG